LGLDPSPPPLASSRTGIVCVLLQHIAAQKSLFFSIRFLCDWRPQFAIFLTFASNQTHKKTAHLSTMSLTSIYIASELLRVYVCVCMSVCPSIQLSNNNSIWSFAQDHGDLYQTMSQNMFFKESSHQECRRWIAFQIPLLDLRLARTSSPGAEGWGLIDVAFITS